MHCFKVAENKFLPKKPTLDPKVLANYRPTSNLPFLSKIPGEAVANVENVASVTLLSLFEDFHLGFRQH